MKIPLWVDIYNGTYGDIGGLRLVNVEEDVLRLWEDGATDSEIAYYGIEHGHPVILVNEQKEL